MAKILLVEDDERIQRLLTLRLKLRGHEVDCATNGQEGVEVAMGDTYALILMDMHMPVMDGHTATQRLRERGYAGLIVAVTASAMSKDSEKAIESGCDDFIAKPIGEDFEQRIEQILDDKS